MPIDFLGGDVTTGYSMKGSVHVWLDRLKNENETVRKRAKRTFCELTPADKNVVPELV